MPNYIRVPGASRKKIAIQSFSRGMDAQADESVLPVSVAKSVYNFDFSSGALKEGYGLTAYPTVPRGVKNIWTYARHDFDSGRDEEILMYAGTDGSVYYLKNGAERHLEGISFSSPVTAVNYRLYGDDVILMTSETDPMAVWDGKSDAYTVENSPLITSMAIHYERMFCTVAGERNSVWFSDDLDPTNWDLELDKGGFIQVIDERGKLNKVISYLNYIYIFRDYGISRLTAFADQSEFAVGNLFVSSGKIYPGSAALCGDAVMFLARDGIYRFDGLSTHKILPGLGNLISASEQAAGVFHDGKYYLACRAAFGDVPENGEGGENNAVLIFDLKSGSYSVLKDVSVTAFTAAGGQLLAVTADGRAAVVSRSGAVFGKPTEKSWTSGFSDFGTEKLKTVREVYIESDGAFTLTVESEKVKKEIFTVPEKGITKIRVNVCGRTISLSIAARTEKARITRPTVIMTS